MNARRPGRLFGLSFLLMSLLPTLAAAQTPAAPAPVDTREAWVANYRWLGAGLSTSFPYTEFGDDYSTGYGIHALVDRPIWPLINLSADLGWNHFAGNGDRQSVDVWNFIFGARLAFGAFFMGAEGGYFSEVEENVGWVPSFGLRFEKLEFALRYVAVGSDSWTTLRAGYYF